MKKLGFVLAVAVIALALAGSALAQNCGESRVAQSGGDCSFYFVTYFSNNGGSAAKNPLAEPDATVRIINDGETGGNLWADFYVFDDSEELSECCSCVVTPDGLLSESVTKELTANPLSGPIRQRGVIKVISDGDGDPTDPYPVAGLRGWATHVQKAASGYVLTEDALADANYSPYEAGALGPICSILLQLGSGYGSCTCTLEDQDF
jgi:hypothetical protein